MLKSPIFTAIAVLSLLVLACIITMQVLEMHTYGMTPLDLFK